MGTIILIIFDFQGHVSLVKSTSPHIHPRTKNNRDSQVNVGEGYCQPILKTGASAFPCPMASEKPSYYFEVSLLGEAFVFLVGDNLNTP